jgi:hypothetical protein
VGDAQFPDDEGGEREDGHDDQRRDHRRVEPIEPLALVQRDLERSDSRHQERKANAVEPAC